MVTIQNAKYSLSRRILLPLKRVRSSRISQIRIQNYLPEIRILILSMTTTTHPCPQSHTGRSCKKAFRPFHKYYPHPAALRLPFQYPKIPRRNRYSWNSTSSCYPRAPTSARPPPPPPESAPAPRCSPEQSPRASAAPRRRGRSVDPAAPSRDVRPPPPPVSSPPPPPYSDPRPSSASSRRPRMHPRPPSLSCSP